MDFVDYKHILFGVTQLKIISPAIILFLIIIFYSRDGIKKRSLGVLAAFVAGITVYFIDKIIVKIALALVGDGSGVIPISYFSLYNNTNIFMCALTFLIISALVFIYKKESFSCYIFAVIIIVLTGLMLLFSYLS